MNLQKNECTCGDNLRKFCNNCTLERKKLVSQFLTNRAQNRSHLGPIRRFVTLANPNPMNRRASARRLDKLRDVLSAKLGKYVSRRLMREIMNDRALEIQKEMEAVK